MTRRAEHDELEPKRLLDERATPDALREQAPSPAASARIRERLASPPPPAPRVGRSLIAIALVTLISALMWRTWPTHESARAPHAGAPSEAPLIRLPATHAVAPKAETPRAGSARAPAAAAQLEQVVEPAEQPATAPAVLLAPAPVPEIVRVPKRAKEPLAPKASNAPLVASTVLEPEPALDVPAKRTLPSPKPLSQGEEAERMFADPQDEAGLLYRARRLSSSDPNAALRLLVLHEASFPDGAFVQERDMLEIQIQERLGHATTAKRLAALFKQRYPESVYRVSP